MRWLKHMERMNDKRVTKRVYEREFECERRDVAQR